MTLPGNITDTIATIDALSASIRNEIDTLSKFFAEATGGAVTVCSSISVVSRLQLYHNRDVCDVKAAYGIIKGMADDAALDVAWEDESTICYEFKLDRHTFCIVLDK